MKLSRNTIRIFACLIAILTGIIAFNNGQAHAASSTNAYWNYPAPGSSDYAYWNGSRTVKSSSTTKNEIKWMQAALNYCIDYRGLNASRLEVDGSFGPASGNATRAFQRKFNLSADGSFGPGTISRMKAVLNGSYTVPSSNSLIWPVDSKWNITGKYNTWRGDHYHDGIDIGATRGSKIYSISDGVVVAVHNSNSTARGKYLLVYYPGRNITALYQHCNTINVKVNDSVSQGQVIATVGGSGYGSSSYYANHLHYSLAYGRRTTTSALVNNRFNPTPGAIVSYINK